jgi:hypothetical protein
MASPSDYPEVVQAEPNETGVYEIESLCMNCRDNVCPLAVNPYLILTVAGCYPDTADQNPFLQGNPPRVILMRPLRLEE